MFPDQPPFPLASRFPFQPVAGIQSSILISESLEGLSVAATRQNAGRSSKDGPCLPRPAAGAVKAPAPTAVAEVMVVSGNFSEARLSQVVAKDAV